LDIRAGIMSKEAGRDLKAAAPLLRLMLGLSGVEKIDTAGGTNAGLAS
jgi:hypothetical protein